MEAQVINETQVNGNVEPEVKPKPEERKPKATFFSEDDVNKLGQIASAYPAWYFTTHIEELESEIQHDEFMIERDLIASENKWDHRAQLKLKKEKLARIRESAPVFNDKQMQKIGGYYHELSEAIRDSMFTYTQMQRGTADAHEEARRMSTPCVKVPGDIARLCNVKLTDGKATRNGAVKVWKILGRILEKPSNVETLRKG